MAHENAGPAAAKAGQDAGERRYLQALGQLVRAQRRAQKLSRRELAERSGVSERFLADIETGKANPSVLRLERVATALETSGAELLSGLAAAFSAGGPRVVIALLGLRGAGKSTIGRALAERLGVPFYELDEDVERRMGLPLTEIFEVHGEAGYRRVEREVLRERLDTGEPCVLATGGGIVTDAETWDLLRARARTVWLRAEAQDHWDRVVAQGDMRPMAGDARAFANLQAILASRVELYGNAQLSADTSGRDIKSVLAELVANLRPEAPAP